MSSQMLAIFFLFVVYLVQKGEAVGHYDLNLESLSDHGRGFSYSNQSAWGGDCTTGNAQSPINIKKEWSTRKDDLRVTLENFEEPLKDPEMVNNGHVAQININDHIQRKVTLDGPIQEAGFRETYILTQLHYHWGKTPDKGSEHAIESEKGALELHMVGVNEKVNSTAEAVLRTNGLVVLTVLFKLGKNNVSEFKAIKQMVREVQHTSQTGKYSGHFSLTHFLPKDRHFYAYKGSLTTPDCNQVVTWVVMRAFNRVPANVYEEFSKIEASKGVQVRANDRDLQPLNGRFLYLSNNFVSLRKG